MKNKRALILFIIITIITFSIYAEVPEQRTVPKARLLADFTALPYFNDYGGNFYGASFMGQLSAGVRVKAFTIGLDVSENYHTLTGYGNFMEFKGAWNILGGSASFYYEPVKWFEFRTGAGAVWYKSALKLFDDREISVSNCPGLSLILDLDFRPWKYISIRHMNTVNLMIDGRTVYPYYLGKLTADFHPYIQWMSLSAGIGLSVWTDTLSGSRLVSVMPVWIIGASLDLTPSDLAIKIVKKNKNKPDKDISRTENTKTDKIGELVRAAEGDVVTFNDIIFFADSEKVKEESYKFLDRITAVLKERPDICIEIRGYTNNVGRSDDEMKLSKKRADVVKSYLEAKGITPQRIKTAGFGSIFSTVIIDEANRKVEIKVIKCGLAP